ncbi:MAG: UDP-glucose/GDP-mannose dehydrogenase family protein [Dehalococcoidia bacterium]
MERSNVMVVGVGRIGAVTAVGLSHLLSDVVAVDVNANRIRELAAGHLSEAEPGLRAALKSANRIRRIRFTTDVADATFDLAFLCVDTPPEADGSPNLRQIFDAAHYAAAHLRPRGIVVTRATVPPGAGDRLTSALKAIGRSDVQVAHVPEFLREGRAWEDFREPDRLVIGANSPNVAQRVRRVFSELPCPVFETDRRTAELAKYAANAYLATSISFANELSDLGADLGADVHQVFEILKADRRIGPGAYLAPGLGFGGHCFPKDTAALEYAGATRGMPMRQLAATIAVNQRRVPSVQNWLRGVLGNLDGRRIAIAGLAFKPATDDLRESPALRLANGLRAEGASVAGFDPLVTCAPPGICLAANLTDAIEAADGLVLSHSGEWFAGLPLPQLAQVMRTPVVYDAALAFGDLPWHEHGIVTNHCNTFACEPAPGSRA